MNFKLIKLVIVWDFYSNDNDPRYPGSSLYFVPPSGQLTVNVTCSLHGHVSKQENQPRYSLYRYFLVFQLGVRRIIDSKIFYGGHGIIGKSYEIDYFGGSRIIHTRCPGGLVCIQNIVG